MRRLAAALALACLLAPALAAAPAQPPRPEKPAEARLSPAAQRSLLDDLWAGYQKADLAGDDEAAAKALGDLVRTRIERNIRSLDIMALALVGKGMERLRSGERERAELYFRGALRLDPFLSDAYLGLAKAQMLKGPFGFMEAGRQSLAALALRWSTWRGRAQLQALLVPALLVALLAAALAVSVALLVKHGGLLLHDLEEELAARRGPSLPRGLFVLVLLLPAVLQQGWAWLPLWWLALLFVYMSLTERLVSVGLLLAAIAVGPMLERLESLILAQQNPLFQASLSAVSAGPDPRALAGIERAAAADPEDRDFSYLLARELRKHGRSEEAAKLYQELLKKDARDAVALNNLAGLEFARGEFQAAIGMYKSGAESAGDPERAATVYYNLSQAHLQLFEFQPATEARAQADRLAAGLTREYEGLWKYEKEGAQVSTVVDLAPSEARVADKFAGRASGVVERNVAFRRAAGLDSAALGRSLLTRFLGFAGVFAFVVAALAQWRGRKLFTLHCPSCGMAFCRRCHLGQVSAGLCTQCYHLFVVRDGVSATARNQKMLEVQKHDDLRHRIFRVLSLLSPGTGQIYAGKTVPGLAAVLAWYAVLAVTLLAGRPLPVTEASSQLLGPWVAAPAVALLAILYLAANRWRPKFHVELPAVRRPAQPRKTGA